MPHQSRRASALPPPRSPHPPGTAARVSSPARPAHEGSPTGAEFRARVLAAVRRIPRGRVATYGDIATRAGSPRAWRRVGSILRDCRDAATPCHRVVGAGGALGGWTGSLQMKRELLRAEGLEAGPRRLRRFDAVRWRQAGSR